jgi:F-box protein 9
MEDSNPDLESFRAQWQAEVEARAALPLPDQPTHATSGPSSGTISSRPTALFTKANLPPLHTLAEVGDEEDVLLHSYHDLDDPEDLKRLDRRASLGPSGDNGKGKLPESALDHYEAASEKEAQGQMGDSVKLYRKAFKVRKA